MTLKKFIFLGSAIAGAAVLANKDRRERLLRSAKDFIDNARRKLETQAQPVDLGTGTGTSTTATTASDYPTPRPF